MIATLWPVADNSMPWLMREFYQSREGENSLTKVEAMRWGQLALLRDTAQARPLPEAHKGATFAVQVVNRPKNSNREGNVRAARVYVAEEDAPTFRRDEKRPFAHPYYWATFILIGNWK